MKEARVEILILIFFAIWRHCFQVYECLQRYMTDSPTPALDYASGLSLQVHFPTTILCLQMIYPNVFYMLNGVVRCAVAD